LGRAAEAAGVVERVARWAAGRSDVVGLLLVGSYARDAARFDSDVDLVLLTTERGVYLADDGWGAGLGLGELVRTQRWGVITERRFRTSSGLEVEVGVGEPGWASVDPVDPGTRRVVTDGARILHDPRGALGALLVACGVGSAERPRG
jgi:predicted nucleotidyltransferase